MKKLIFLWAAFTLVFSLLIGGAPWEFPQKGRLWIDAFLANSLGDR